MKIISFTDVITNSSSEVYLIKSDKSSKEIEEELYKIRDSYEYRCSGMGGDIDVNSNKDDSVWSECLDEGYLVIDIDWNLDEVIEYLETNYGILQDINRDDKGPYTDMEVKWAKKRISELEKEALNTYPSEQKEIYTEINRLNSFVNAHN